MLTPEIRKQRRKMRRAQTRDLSQRAYHVFMSCFKIRDSFHATPTKELAALAKAGNRIKKLVEGCQMHLDKRYEEAKKNRSKLEDD